MRLERRRPRLHECEAQKGSRDLRPAKFDVAEKRDVCREGRLRSSRIRRLTVRSLFSSSAV